MVIILLPVVIAFALTVTTILESGRLAEELGRFAFVLRGTQYILIWLGFIALYYVVPNTHVRVRYALLSGVVAGTLWCFMSFLYVKLQFGIGRFDAIYSSFSVIPLLIMWIYLSWVIMLFGAELTYAYQNEKTFAMERWAAGASFAYREAVGLRAMIEIGRRFDAGEPGLAVTESAEQWHVPSRLLNETIEQLEDAGLVRQCATDPVTFVPARSPDKICVGEVVAALREAGRDPSDLREDEALKPLLTDVAGARNKTMREPLADWVLRLHPTMQALPANGARIIELNESATKNDASG
jgi:membrane protein